MSCTWNTISFHSIAQPNVQGEPSSSCFWRPDGMNRFLKDFTITYQCQDNRWKWVPQDVGGCLKCYPGMGDKSSTAPSGSWTEMLFFPEFKTNWELWIKARAGQFGQTRSGLKPRTRHIQHELHSRGKERGKKDSFSTPNAPIYSHYFCHFWKFTLRFHFV